MTNLHFLKTKLSLLFVTLVVFTTQSQDIQYEKSFGGVHSEYLYDAIPTPDYGYLLAGSSISDKNGNKEQASQGDLDYWIWKINEKGNIEFQKSFGGTGVDLLKGVQLTTDGGMILAGSSTSNLSGQKAKNGYGDADIWLIKLDAAGNEEWQKTIGGVGQEELQSIERTSDGGYILGCSSNSDQMERAENSNLPFYGKSENSRGNMDYWVIKLDAKGEIEWNKTFGGMYFDQLQSVQPLPGVGYILGGYSNSPASGDKTEDNIGTGDFWILKLDLAGNILSQKTIGGDQDDHLFTLIPTKDGGLIAGGNSNSGATHSKSVSNGNGTDFWVVKLDANLNIQWQESYDYGQHDVLSSIIENQEGSYLIGGYAQSEEKTNPLAKTITTDKKGINDYIALKINHKGEEIWSKTVGSKGDEVLRKLFETRDGAYIFAGTSSGAASGDKNSSKGANDFWVVKLKDNDKPETPRTNMETLPNPAVSFTNVIINIDYSEGTVTLYDLNGRVINQTPVKGERTVPVNLSNLPTGIYVIDVKTNNGQEGIKVIKK